MTNIIYTKQDNELLATKTLYTPEGETYEETVTYTKEFLDNQVIAITNQRDEMIALKEAELAEVNNLLAKCEELEITE